jgi:hypothetical protein
MFNLPANEQYKDTGISPTSGLATQIFSFVLAPGGSFGTTLFWYLAGSSREYIPCILFSCVNLIQHHAQGCQNCKRVGF